MPRPSHYSRFYHPNNIGLRVQIIKFPIMLFSPLLCCLAPFWPKYTPQQYILQQPQPNFLPQGERPVFTPIQTNSQNYSSVYLSLSSFCIANWKTKDSAPNDSKRSLTSVCS